MPIKKLLALNRGEIAIRIFRAANELKIRTAAVYSDEDRLSLHRFKADEAYLIGEGKGPVQAYLDVDGIVALAKDRGVDAIHPGYGFLSENPALPRACAAVGITFVGPSADLLDLLGDKTAARRLAQKAGLRVVPGTEEQVTQKDDAQILADTHGNVLHLHERDCCVQRRNQKVVEVAPAVNLDPKIRTGLANAAVAL